LNLWRLMARKTGGVYMPGPGRRFEKGCKGGPGRPPKHVEEAFLDACRQALTPEALQRLLEGLVFRAGTHRGDRAAAILLKLVFGDKPLLPKLVADGGEAGPPDRLANAGPPAPLPSTERGGYPDFDEPQT
jgi:hypothetical protein